MDIKEFNSQLANLILKSGLRNEEVINSMVSQIQSLRPVQKPAKAKANPDSDGQYDAKIVGKPDYWKCMFLDGDWFYRGRLVKITDWK